MSRRPPGFNAARREQLLDALRHAGRRGLTAREMRALVGNDWRRRLHELLDDGYVIVEDASRYVRRGRRSGFRWRLLAGPPPAAPETTQPALFEPPASPASALTEDFS